MFTLSKSSMIFRNTLQKWHTGLLGFLTWRSEALLLKNSRKVGADKKNIFVKHPLVFQSQHEMQFVQCVNKTHSSGFRLFLCLSRFFFVYSFTEISYLILYCTCKETCSITHCNWPYQMKSWSYKFKRFHSANICKHYSEPQYNISFSFFCSFCVSAFYPDLFFWRGVEKHNL